MEPKFTEGQTKNKSWVNNICCILFLKYFTDLIANPRREIEKFGKF